MSSDDHCSICGILIGRAGRTNEEIIALHKVGEFFAKIESWDYSITPPGVISYCTLCWDARKPK